MLQIKCFKNLKREKSYLGKRNINEGVFFLLKTGKSCGGILSYTPVKFLFKNYRG